jgi:hypothetical protein
MKQTMNKHMKEAKPNCRTDPEKKSETPEAWGFSCMSIKEKQGIADPDYLSRTQPPISRPDISLTHSEW